MGKLAVVVMALLCFGMAGGAYFVSIHQPTQTMNQAEVVEGTVTSTAVESQDDTYVPVVTYEYQFEGETYTNDQIKLVGSVGFASPGGAEAFLESYAAGDTVSVNVVPQTPSKSFLERGSAGLTMYGIIGFLGLLGLFSVIALVGDLLGVEAIDIK